MSESTLISMGVGGCIFLCINAAFWFWTWTFERRWTFISKEVARMCLHRMWLNLGLAAICALFAAAGWWMQGQYA